MKFPVLQFAMITSIIFLSACNTLVKSENVMTPTQVEDIVSSPEPSPSPEAADPTSTATIPAPTIAPTSVPVSDNPQYVITVKVDYNWHKLSVAQSVTIPNPSTEPIEELILVVQSNWYPSAFHLIELTWGDGSPIENYDLEGIELRIALDNPISPGETRNIAMVYDLVLPPISTSEEYGPIPFGFTNRQTNLVDWYPYVPPYQEGEGWLVHKPWFYGEHLVYPVADFDIALEVMNAPASLSIAASALDTGDENIHRYQLKNGRNFVFSLSPSYKVFEGQVGDTIVLGYAFTYDHRAGQAAFDTTIEALTLFEEIFHPYEQPVMTLIEADFLHGMEYQNLYFLSRGFYNTFDDAKGSFLVSIAAHETAHQWWYGLVGNDQALEPWLDEALCTYSELLFYEHLYPEALDTWWWPQRVAYYEPTGWVDLHLYNSGGYRPYRDAVYFQGAYFLDELRSSMGDEAFFSFLQTYIVTFKGKIATTDDFFNLLTTYTSAEFDNLRAKYFQGTP
ncbi:MAG: M1 family metallopeptidase [Chloroflexi bacterium]|nr:M1 family metallopeptidase [Chloroflexota bacterium]